jgi:hypothetical protein
MRKTLAELEGQWVAFSGWETGSRHNQTWVCVSKAYVRVWNKDDSVQTAVKRKGGYRFDHLWLTGDGEKSPPQGLKMFDRIGGIGIVRKYQRNDGSFDYTVKSPRNRYSIEEFLDQYNENFEKNSQQERLDLLQQALRVVEAHQNGSDDIVFGMAKSVSRFKAEISAQELEIRRSIEATESALKTATMNGKCKSLDVVSFSARTARKSKGF